MSRIEHSTPRWSGWLGHLIDGAKSALTSVARRLGPPTLLGVPVSAAILTRVAAVSPHQPLDEVAQLFVVGRHALMPVVEDGRPISVITRSDVAAGLATAGPHAPVADAPSHHVVTVGPSDSLADVLARLGDVPDSIAVVVDHGGPVGVLTLETVEAYLDGATRRVV